MQLLTVCAILPLNLQLGAATVCTRLLLPRTDSTRYSISRFTLHTPPHTIVTIKLVPAALHWSTARFTPCSTDILHACNLVLLAESRTLSAHAHTVYRSAQHCCDEFECALH
jgi:hypothetical protein